MDFQEFMNSQFDHMTRETRRRYSFAYDDLYAAQLMVRSLFGDDQVTNPETVVAVADFIRKLDAGETVLEED